MKESLSKYNGNLLEEHNWVQEGCQLCSIRNHFLKKGLF